MIADEVSSLGLWDPEDNMASSKTSNPVSVNADFGLR